MTSPRPVASPPAAIELVGGPCDGAVVPYPFLTLWIPAMDAPGWLHAYVADGALARYAGLQRG